MWCTFYCLPHQLILIFSVGCKGRDKKLSTFIFFFFFQILPLLSTFSPGSTKALEKAASLKPSLGVCDIMWLCRDGSPSCIIWTPNHLPGIWPMLMLWRNIAHRNVPTILMKFCMIYLYVVYHMQTGTPDLAYIWCIYTKWMGKLCSNKTTYFVTLCLFTVKQGNILC